VAMLRAVGQRTTVPEPPAPSPDRARPTTP
jgi:hypothetical protein